MTKLIRIQDLSFRYQQTEKPVFAATSATLSAGDFALLAGPTGSGKSTFLKTICGLTPAFTGGSVSGSITIDGTEILGRKPNQLSRLVGYVAQQAEGSFVAATVAEEIAFVLEQQGLNRQEMSARITWAAECVGLENMLTRACSELSGGEQQRLAIAAAIAGGSQVLLLDEPTSELDPIGASQIIALLQDLAKRRGLTVIVAEHKIDRLLPLVSSVLVASGETIVQVSPSDLTTIHKAISSPMIALATKAGWESLPATIDIARASWFANPGLVSPRRQVAQSHDGATPALQITNLEVRILGQTVVSLPRLEVYPGETVALIGPNGAGKSSLFWGLLGELPTQESEQGLSSVKHLAPMMALVPQSAADLLLMPTVAKEFAQADDLAEKPEGTTREILTSLIGDVDETMHPRDLSAGQQLGLALAIQLVRDVQLLLLDEPTRGLDYRAKHELALILRRLSEEGMAILIASHDIDFVAEVADNCVQLERGKVVAAGRAETVLAALGPNSPTAWQVTGQVTSVSEVVDA